MSFLKQITIITGFIACTISATFAEQKIEDKYIFRQINSKSGLSDNNIRNMIMQQDGIMVLYSPTMLSIFDGISYIDKPFNSTFIPFKEYSIEVEMITTHNNKVMIFNGDRTWYFNINDLNFIYHNEISDMPLSNIKAAIYTLDGNYFFYTKDEEFKRYNYNTKSTISIETPSLLTGNVKMAQYEHYIYILTKGGSLFKYDTKLGTFTNAVTNLIKDNISETKLFDIDVDSNGNIWVLFERNITRIDAHKFTYEHILCLAPTIESVYTSIDTDSKGRLWVGSSLTGMWLIDTHTGEVKQPKIEVINNSDISTQINISNIYVDHKGGVWVATEADGVLYYHDDMFRLKAISDIIENEKVKSIITDKDGSILFGTYNGLYRYDPTNGNITTPYKQIANEDCISLYRDRRDRIWVGTFRHGLFCIDNGKVRNYFYSEMPIIEESYNNITPNYNCMRCVYEDSNGNFWVSIYGGLARFDTESGEIELISKEKPEITHYMFVRNIIQVGNSIFASGNDGYYTYDLDTHNLDIHPSNSNYYNKCNMAIADKHGDVWVATSMGLRIVRNGQEHQIITIDDGLTSNNIIAVAEDRLSNIWAISPSSASRISILDRGDGLSKYKISISSFTESDGLNAGILFPKSITTDNEGRIYVGGSHGMCIINPSELYQANETKPPLLTNLYINNTLINVGEEYNNRVILKQRVGSTKEIVLNHDESFISFEFSNFNYINPQHTLYRYKLENFDKDWTQINSTGSGKVTYTLLKPGSYTLKVKAANNGTDWEVKSTQLSIVIKPPFYQTRLAFIIYFALTMIAILLILNFINIRTKERLMQRQQMESERMNQMKFRFFTNVSHELRTPLSLILLPLNNIIRRTPKDSEITPQLLTIERNASHLLSLVNHLLDMRKLEMGGEKLTLTKNRPAELIEAIISDFSNSASEKKITIKMCNTLGDKYCYFDKQHMNKVFNNLISNALKFTPEGGSVTITISYSTEDYLIIEVSDTGVGISKDNQELIFDRFYQIKDQELHTAGSGIGLHLVKQYVELHKGDISVESELGVGSTFRIELPNFKAGEQSEDIDAIDESTSQNEEFDILHDEDAATDKFKILIVEDNTDFRNYLAMELKSLSYEVYTASDGEEGINKARNIHPSLIISDIMMPKSDGFTLCNTLKNDINTSHIPIILLTARTADDVRYEGYKAGADAYISKPFSFNILEIRIRKLIEERQHRLDKIKTTREIKTSHITVNSLDEKLMAQIIEHIEKNMSNAEYSVEQLSADVAMHRMNLYRKIQSIAGMTPSEFLRTMRIKRAAQLLEKDSGLSIVEISEMVGFNTPRYFTNYFRKMYGVTPSQYAAELKKNREIVKK